MCTQGFLQEKQDLQVQRGDKNLRDKLLEIEYGEPNTRMKSVIQAARECRKNLVLTHSKDDLREDRLVDGTVKSMVVGTKAAGWKHIEQVVDIVVRTEMQREVEKETKKKVRAFCGTISLCGLAPEMTGLRMLSPTYDKLEQFIKAYRGEE